MNRISPSPSWDSGDETRFASTLKAIFERAPESDRGRCDLAEDMASLFASGYLARLYETVTGSDVGVGASLLQKLGAANLSVGRLAEGHVNALRLIDLYGSAAQKALARSAAAKGELFGVWGAEGKTPVSIQQNDDGRAVLQGEKRFCSGLGIVRHAIVTAACADGVQLVLIAADAAARHDVSSWRTSGMRATASGSFNMNGLEGATVGEVGDYIKEPHFEGGIWRYCALHSGALGYLSEALSRQLRQRGEPSAQQASRLVEMHRLAQTARLWVEHAAECIENSPHPTVETSLLAREAVEDACLRGIAIIERAFGTSAFMQGEPVERVIRDLSFFLRQANLDGKTSLAARLILGRGQQSW